MSALKNIREKQNLTQEELSASSGISARTIQRIEAGTAPKGYTLKSLAKALNVTEEDLLGKNRQDEISEERVINGEESVLVNYRLVKLINLSSIPFTILPPLNVLLPIVLMYATKQKNPVIKQIISVQIIWTIFAPILFMLVILTKPGNQLTLVTIAVLVIANIYVILRNAMEIDRNKRLRYKLNFNII